MVESFGLLRQKDIVAKMVGYIMGNTEYVTDFSEGSIIRSLCEAVAEELYSSNVAFAQGVIGAINSSVKQAFNFPSLQASNATGVYTFYRKMLASPITLSTSTTNSQKGISLVSGGILPYSNATWSIPTYFGITGVTSTGKENVSSTSYISVLDGYNTVRLRWFTENGYSSYRVYRASINPSTVSSLINAGGSPVSGTTTSNALVAQQAKNSPSVVLTTATIDGLIASGATYWYSVASHNATTGESAASTPQSIQAGSTTAATNKITLAITNASGDTSVAWYVYRSATQNMSAASAVYVQANSVIDIGLSASTIVSANTVSTSWLSRTWHGTQTNNALVGKYFFSITAFDTEGLESLGQYPVSATYTSGVPVLYWSGVAGLPTNVSSYRIYRSIIGTPVISSSSSTSSASITTIYSLQSSLSTGESSAPTEPVSIASSSSGVASFSFPTPYNGLSYATAFNIYRSSSNVVFTATISGNTMNVTAVSSGTFSIGQIVVGTTVTSNSLITALGTGTGGTGAYTLSQSSTISSPTSMVASNMFAVEKTSISPVAHPDAPVVTTKTASSGSYYGLSAIIVGSNYETESEIVLFSTGTISTNLTTIAAVAWNPTPGTSPVYTAVATGGATTAWTGTLTASGGATMTFAAGDYIVATHSVAGSVTLTVTTAVAAVASVNISYAGSASLASGTLTYSTIVVARPVIFTWTSSASSNITKYRLYKSDTADFTTSVSYYSIPKNSSGSTTSFIVTGNSTAYNDGNIFLKRTTITESASRSSAVWPSTYYPMNYSYTAIANPVIYPLQGASVSWQTLASSVAYSGKTWPYIHTIANIANSSLSVIPYSDPEKQLVQYDDNGSTKPISVNGETTGNYYSLWNLINNAQAISGDITISNGLQVRVPGTSKTYAVNLSSKNFETLSSSVNSIDVPIQASFPGLSGNTPSNTITEIVNTIYGISSGSNRSALINGRDAETESEWKIRFSAYMRSLARGTKDSLEEGAKTASLVNTNGSVIESVIKSYAIEDGTTTVNLFIHNGSGQTCSQDLSEKTRKIINGYIENGNYFAGYKPSGIAVIIKPVVFFSQNLSISLTLLGGYSLTSVSDSVRQAVEDYFYSLDISDGFTLSVVTVSANASVNSSDKYRVVLTDSNGNKSFPSSIFEGYSSFVYTVPINNIGPSVTKVEILKWRSYYSDWGLADTIYNSGVSLSGATWLDPLNVDANTLDQYIFTNPLRKYFQKSVLSRSILRVPGVAAVQIKILDASNVEQDVEYVVAGEGYVMLTGTVSVS